MSKIDYEITYPSGSRFVFHDSRGIEAGSESDTRGTEAGEGHDSSTLRVEYIQKFINDRAQQRRLADQLHAIWFVFCNSYMTFDIKLLKVLHANGHSKGA